MARGLEAETEPESATSDLAISLRGVSMVFGGAGAVQALHNVDLDVRAGEFVSLIGPSGCGKSTLLRLIGDLLAPTGGTISVNGKTPRDARLSRQYGIVFQQPVLYDWRTVTANVQLPLEVMKVAPPERRARATELLRLVGLTEFADHYPWQLSGGMQQRVSIARALSFRPSVLLMDEPFGALDEMTRERLNRELLSVWAETSTAIVFVTHSIPEAVFLSDRVVVMSPRPGRVETLIDVTLPRPRNIELRDTPGFVELVAAVRRHLREVDT
ncbi:MAG: ABC transporter ATP-binding protein [Chloroflexi bacterium]|nr:ABC transporter ATP-binding protein [Chloroflexota bacterium]